MPERFLSPDTRKGGKKNNNTVLIIILAAVLLLGGGAAATVYFLVKPNQNGNNSNSSQSNINVTPPVNTANLNNSSNGNTNGSSNSNTNGSTNGNSNGNTNSLSNFNNNRNSNSLFNTNTTNQNNNRNGNANSNNNLNQNTNSSVVRTTPLPSTLDSDSDGLTDVEEALYGTTANKPDTDADGFIDGKKLNSSNQCGELRCYDGEVFNKYNPLGSGYLDTSGLVNSFRNSIFNYSILYPAQWVPASNSDSRTTLFAPSDPTGETIQVIVLDNPSRLTALNYYRSMNPGVNTTLLESVTANGLEGMRTPTGEDVYLAKSDKIYNISYSVGQLPALNFMTTFEMMYRSFRLTSS